MSRGEPEVHLYCRKVLIQAKAKGLFPEWLRFLRGVVDSEDLPLNISRETMQDSALLQEAERRADEARAHAGSRTRPRPIPDKYARFIGQHGHCLKEGVATDWTHREALAKLLRFESSHTEAGKLTSLARLRQPHARGAEAISIILMAPSRESAEASPYYEVFREKKWEVLFLTDPRDEFVMDHLHTFDSKRLVAAEKAEVQLDTEASRTSLARTTRGCSRISSRRPSASAWARCASPSGSPAAPPWWWIKTRTSPPPCGAS